MIPLRRANASSGLVSNVHGGEYVSSCLILDVATQLLGFPETGLGHPSIVLAGFGGADNTSGADSCKFVVPSSAFVICANGKSTEAADVAKNAFLFI